MVPLPVANAAVALVMSMPVADGGWMTPVGGGTTFSLAVALLMVVAGTFAECGTMPVPWYWNDTAPPPVNCVPPGFICTMNWSTTITWPAAGAGKMLAGAAFIPRICAAV